MSADAEKKHAPTQRRRDQVLQNGDTPRSPLLGSAIVLLAAALVASLFGGSLLRWYADKVGDSWQTPLAISTNQADLELGLSRTIIAVAGIGVGAACLLGIVAGLLQLAQFGGHWFPRAIEVKWERISPTSGASRIFSWDTAAGLVFDLAKGAALVGGVGWVIYSQAPSLATVGWRPPDEVLNFGWSSIWKASVVSLGSLVLIGALEYLWKRFRWEHRLRMTDQELRDELREQEKNPTVAREQRRRSYGSSTATTAVSSIDAQAPV